MTIWTRSDIDAGKVRKLDDASRACPDCKAVNSWTVQGCAACKSNETPEYLCGSCSQVFHEEWAEYRAVAPSGNVITEPLLANRCPSCTTVYMMKWHTE